MRTESSEQRGRDDESPPLDAKEPRQRDNPPFEPLSIRISRDESATTAPQNLGEVLRLIAEQACLATSATASAIALKERDEIICRATAGPHTPDLGISLNVSSGLSGACVRTREAQYCEDTETDPRVNAEACRRLQIRSVLIVPLLKDQELLGVFEIFSPSPQAFARHDLQNLNSLANVVMDSLHPYAEDALPELSAEERLAEALAPFETEIPSFVAPTLAPVDQYPLAAEAPPVVAAESPLVGAESEASVAPWIETSPAAFEEPTGSQEISSTPTGSPLASLEMAGVPALDPPAPHEPIAPQIVAPAPIASPPVRPARAVTKAPPAPVSMPEAPAWTAPTSDDFLSSTTALVTRPRDWMGTVLTVAVVCLALTLGWMLGRVGWERAMGTRHSSSPSTNPTNAEQASSATSDNAGEADPIVVDNRGRGSASNRANEPSPRKSPFRTKAAGSASPDGGLTVYQDGKVIFEQRSSNGADSSAGATSPRPTSAPPIAVTSQVAGSHLVQRVEPVYPEVARQQHIQGEVVLEAVVGKDGTVRELRLISGDSQLAAAASDAVQQWRFRPFEQHGQAADFSTRLTVNFRLH